jgi:RNA polymerase sigma factor (sigma-70 family)
MEEVAMAQWKQYDVNDAGARQAGWDDIEQKCLQRLTQGDLTAFWELWRQYQEKLLFRYSLNRMHGHYEDAEDALSAASIKAYKGLRGSPEDITNVKGWLLRLLHNHCIDVCRARERYQRMIQMVEDIDIGYDRAITRQGSVEDIVSRYQITDYIMQAIDDLPSRLREASRLRFVHDMSCRDIAMQLNLSPENVRKRLQQARALLQPALAKYK